MALQDQDSWVRAAATEALQNINTRLARSLGNNNRGGGIWMAIRGGDIEAVNQHLANGVNVNIISDNGGTPLGWAALLGQYEVAELLIQKGASVNSKGGDGGTALHAAAFLGRLEVVKLLIEN